MVVWVRPLMYRLVLLSCSPPEELLAEPPELMLDAGGELAATRAPPPCCWYVCNPRSPLCSPERVPFRPIPPSRSEEPRFRRDTLGCFSDNLTALHVVSVVEQPLALEEHECVFKMHQNLQSTKKDLDKTAQLLRGLPLPESGRSHPPMKKIFYASGNIALMLPKSGRHMRT